MKNRTAIAITTNNTTTNGVVKHKRSTNYLKHIFLGAIIAVCTFTATLAAQPSIATEPDYPGVAYIVSNASKEDVEFLVANHMDEKILEEMDIEIEETAIPLSNGEYIMSYINRDDSIVTQVVDYFVDK